MKTTIIMKQDEALEIITALEQLARVYAALGMFEDAQPIQKLVEALKKRLGK